jgi:hypothetical protein
MHYEVQHSTLFHGWRNTWSYADADGVMQLETFATADEANAALDEFFTDLAEDIAAGYCPPCERDEFRIRQIGGTATAAQPNAAGGAS